MEQPDRNEGVNIRLETLEKKVEGIEEDIKEHRRQISEQNIATARIEVIVEGLKAQWVNLEVAIRQSLDSQSQDSNTTAWKDVTIEAIKMIGFIAGAIVAGKIFL